MPLHVHVAPDEMDARREIMVAIRRLRASQTVQDSASKFLRLQQKMRQRLAEESAEGIRIMTSSLTSATSSEEPCKEPAADEMVLLWTDIISAPKTLHFEAPRAHRPTIPTPCGASLRNAQHRINTQVC
jgi:hypothetical protein